MVLPGRVLYIRRKEMKRKELEEFKKRWEENLGGLGEMLNSPWFAVSIKYDEAEKISVVLNWDNTF